MCYIIRALKITTPHFLNDGVSDQKEFNITNYQIILIYGGFSFFLWGGNNGNVIFLTQQRVRFNTTGGRLTFYVFLWSFSNKYTGIFFYINLINLTNNSSIFFLFLSKYFNAVSNVILKSVLLILFFFCLVNNQNQKYFIDPQNM